MEKIPSVYFVLILIRQSRIRMLGTCCNKPRLRRFWVAKSTLWHRKWGFEVLKYKTWTWIRGEMGIFWNNSNSSQGEKGSELVIRENTMSTHLFTHLANTNEHMCQAGHRKMPKTWHLFSNLVYVKRDRMNYMEIIELANSGWHLWALHINLGALVVISYNWPCKKKLESRVVFFPEFKV